MDPARKAVWFVESHSREVITLDDIAKACHVSAYHLTRVFASAYGLPLMRYVRGRRLTRAARQLAGGADNILAVAIEAGYGSHEAFTRAFGDQFGCTPEQIRKQGHLQNIKLVEAIEMSTAPSADVQPDRFESLGAFTVAGLIERHDCQAKQGISDQWQRFGPHIGRIPGQVGRDAYGVIDNFDEDSHFDYMAGVEVQGSQSIPTGLKTIEIPAQKYVVFRHQGHVAGISSTMSAIWSQWFPKAPHQPAEGPMFEKYSSDFDPATGHGGFEIWIPIRS